MANELKRLAAPELELLYKAPILVSILIAGADGTIDRKEIKGALATAQKKAETKTALRIFYQNVAEDFEDKLKILEQSYPSQPAKRAALINIELTALNDIFKKVDNSLSIDIYESLKNLALNIAKSSGGIFGSKIGPEEAELIDLKMIERP